MYEISSSGDKKLLHYDEILIISAVFNHPIQAKSRLKLLIITSNISYILHGVGVTLCYKISKSEEEAEKDDFRQISKRSFRAKFYRKPTSYYWFVPTMDMAAIRQHTTTIVFIDAFKGIE